MEFLCKSKLICIGSKHFKKGKWFKNQTEKKLDPHNIQMYILTNCWKEPFNWKSPEISKWNTWQLPKKWGPPYAFALVWPTGDNVPEMH